MRIGEEGTFLLCSFWLISVLAREGRVDRAEEIFENVRNCSSSVGLLAEQVDVERGELLGNFPQAFSHIGFINSAIYIVQAEDGRSAFDSAETVVDPYGSGSVTRD
nr:glycoside hydrolase family 15 protein [Haladaptatus sp. W1]